MCHGSFNPNISPPRSPADMIGRPAGRSGFRNVSAATFFDTPPPWWHDRKRRGNVMITRRDLFRYSTGTALGSLTALGADLTPKIALAQEARIAQAREFPSVCP